MEPTVGREPSFMAMWHAWLRHEHAVAHRDPVLDDRRSLELVPDEIRERVVAAHGSFSPATGAAIVAMAVVRHRLLLDRLPAAHERGVRQLVILGAGLDTTAFALPAGCEGWRVFEVDEPATQGWKRDRLAAVGWSVPAGLVFAPCDFEVRRVIDALDDAGFDRSSPAVVSLFGVLLYLSVEATRTLLGDLGGLAAGSEVVLTFSPPFDGADPVVEEVWDRAAPIAAGNGEGMVGFWLPSDLDRLVREAGFRDALHHPVDDLNKRYFADRDDGLRVHRIEEVLRALC